MTHHRIYNNQISAFILGLIIGLAIMFVAYNNIVSVNNHNLDKAKEQIVSSVKSEASSLTQDEILDPDFLRGYHDAADGNVTTMSRLQLSDPQELNPRTHRYFEGWNARIKDEAQNSANTNVNNVLGNQ